MSFIILPVSRLQFSVHFGQNWTLFQFRFQDSCMDVQNGKGLVCPLCCSMCFLLQNNFNYFKELLKDSLNFST
jgi:hypothetical protein